MQPRHGGQPQQPSYRPEQSPYGQLNEQESQYEQETQYQQKSQYEQEPRYEREPGYEQEPRYQRQSRYGEDPRYGHGRPESTAARYEREPRYEQDPRYGQPQYGQPQPSPYGTGGYQSAAKQGNGFAIAGIVLAFLIPLLGLIFSIIGLAKSKARAGAGKVLSITGIVVSLVVGGVAVAAIGALANSVAHSTAADPGCISAENDARQMTNTLNADSAAITRDQNNSSAEEADLHKFLTDMQSLQGQWSTAETEAQHQSVKVQIAAVNSDLKTLTSSLQAIENGDMSKVNDVTSAANKLQSDANTLDSTCSSL
jgi:hypothetical protein